MTLYPFTESDWLINIRLVVSALKSLRESARTLLL